MGVYGHCDEIRFAGTHLLNIGSRFGHFEDARTPLEEAESV